MVRGTIVTRRITGVPLEPRGIVANYDRYTDQLTFWVSTQNPHPLRAYLAATPTTDAEKRAAADLALKGVVICFLGLLFPPLILVGLVPLYFGARKVIHVSMGLGLVDDIDLPGA